MTKLFHPAPVRWIVGAAAVVILAVSAEHPIAAQTAASSSAGGEVESSGESSGRAKVSLTPLIVQEGERLVASKIICAGQPSEKRLQTLARQGIPILNLRLASEMASVGFDEAQVVKSAGGSYRAISLSAERLGDSQLQKQLFDAIDEIQQRTGATYVHGRTGDMVGAALALHAAKRGGQSVDAALKLGKEALLGDSEARVKELLGASTE